MKLSFFRVAATVLVALALPIAQGLESNARSGEARTTRGVVDANEARRLYLELKPSEVLDLPYQSIGTPKWPRPVPELLEADNCESPPSPSTFQDAVDLKYSAITALKRLEKGPTGDSCSDSRVMLFCLSGSCRVLFNSGQYGYHPARCSRARIGDRVWSWCGDIPSSISMEMWKHLDDGLEVATRISMWPDGTTNTREFPVKIRAAKIATYNASLGR